MRKLILYPLIVLAGLAVGIFLSDGAFWTLFAGAPDMGRADFARAERPPNEFVACSAALECAAPDLVVGTHWAQDGAVRASLNQMFADAERVDDGADPLHQRYVVRTPLLRFPDTVSIDLVPQDRGTALRISSRSQIGQSDFGVNGARVRDLVARLGFADAAATGADNADTGELAEPTASD